MNEHAISLTWPRFLAASGVLLALIFTLFKPGISGGLTGVSLGLFWVAHVFSALLILQAVQLTIAGFKFTSDYSPWLQVLVSGLLGAVLFTPLAGAFDHVFGVDEMTDDQAESLLTLLISEFTGVVGILTLVWVGLNATRLVQIQPLERSASPTVQTTAIPSFWARVPKNAGRDLIALSAELQYIRIYTTNGTALTLFPFGQAVEQLTGSVEGMQIHRSHWVAFSHIENV